MFKFLGLVVGIYTLYAAASGAVYAKSGVWGRIITRDESPQYFWVVIAIYTGLALALTTIF